jgi:tryptophanyl-tRNA synthetase
MTLPWEHKTLREKSVATGALLFACGIDPARSIVFIQSDVKEHAELAWVLTCIARMGELRRMVQFKEKSKGESETVGVGIFTYPVLQAADVLLYRAHGVPVGEDQRQHIELMRDLAIRFNSMFGKTFVVPEAWVPKAGARIMALDDPTQKMSKSAPRPNSKILLVDPPDLILKKVKSAVTDSGSEVKADADKPALTNLLTMLSVIEGTPVPELEDRFRGSGYGDFKKVLAEAVVEWLTPVRERFDERMRDPGETARQLGEGADKAREVASKVMGEVRTRVGLA